jgi:hypothetical protein
MSHAEGTYLGGIRTIEDLRIRCRLDDETGCWHWGMAMVQGNPKVHFVLDGRRLSTRGRKAALLLAGKEIKPGHVVFATRSCKSDDCVNPAHARSADRANHGSYLKATGKAISPAKTAAARKTVLAKLAKITMEDARAIRNSRDPQAKLAEKYGIAQSAIWSIKNNRAWRELAPQASVFAWAGGRS